MQRICIVGLSGKLGQLMARHALDRGYEVTGVCRPESVGKLGELADRVEVVPGQLAAANEGHGPTSSWRGTGRR